MLENANTMLYGELKLKISLPEIRRSSHMYRTIESSSTKYHPFTSQLLACAPCMLVLPYCIVLLAYSDLLQLASRILIYKRLAT